MNPEQAWQSVKGQLQADMPLPTFNSWVAEAEFVSFVDGVFTISAPTTGTRDWLDNRLNSTVTRLLVGMLNQPALKVEFVVRTGLQEDLDDPDLMEIEVDYASIQDHITHPERVVVLPAYFERHLAIIGPSLGCLYLGFRQAAYSAGSRKGHAKEMRVTAHQVIAFSAMSLRTFQRHRQNQTTWKALDGLVTRIDHTPGESEWVQYEDGRSHRRPPRYKVAMTLPLTAPDAHRLRSWLQQARATIPAPLDVLRRALETPPTEIIPWPPLAEDILPDTYPQNVQSIVKDVFPVDGAEERELLLDLANRLHKHLIPDGDILVISHYFIKNWWQRLGAGPGWLITLLRDRAFMNEQTGEQRDVLTFANGYQDLADLLGLRRPRTIGEWLADDNVALFLRELECGDGPRDTAWRQLQVTLHEPLAPEDAKSLGDQIEVGETGANGTIRSGANGTVSGAIVTPSGANGTYSGAFGTVNRREWHSLSSFKHLNTPLISESTTPKTVVGGGWNLTRLLIQNHVSAQKRKELEDAKVKASCLVSWLLYAAGQSGHSLDYPVSYAISRLKEDPHHGAGGAYDRLACLPPEHLAHFIRGDLEGHSSGDPDWRGAIGKTSRSRLRVLAEQLAIPEQKRVGRGYGGWE